MVPVNLIRSGYTLPVFACAAAVAALDWLQQGKSIQSVQIDLVEPPQTVEIPVEQIAGLRQGMALAITRSDPGDNLDLTRNTPIWALVEWVGEQGRWGDGEARGPLRGWRGEGSRGAAEQGRLGAPSEELGAPLGDKGQGGERGDGEAVVIKGGEGLGRCGEGGEAAIYAYAQKLIRENLGKLLKSGEKIEVTIILPEGRRLAKRTSNAAFGVVDGLSLLGTTGISQPLSAPGQLDACREEVQQKASCFECLVFCVGENGLDLAAKLGINPDRLVKTANWLGPLLVEAGLQGVKAVLLFGYHGKLIKLAGGIFHTHHHLADGRLEILTAHCAQVGLPTPVLQAVFASSTAEAALKYLRDLDATEGSTVVNQVYSAIAETIDRRSQDYIFNHSEHRVTIGSILFDRDRQIIVKSQTASTLLAHLC